MLCPITFYGQVGSYLGETVRIDGFPARPRSHHVLSAQLSNFGGDILIEVSLCSDPSNEDWSEIQRWTEEPSGSKTLGWKFISKAIWLRVRLENVIAGRVDEIIVR